MVNDFIRHIRTNNLLDLEKTYLLAISGGIDSVFLGYMLKSTGFDFSLAHVNYQLRGQESDLDEDFVIKLAKEWQVKIFLKKADLEEWNGKNQSTQMAARELRYSWFDELVATHRMEGVLTAHHFEDQVETVMLNLLRGTGIEGVYGMSERRDNIIRPLLTFRRSVILDYMLGKGYAWREDGSNKKSEYKRNYIRNEVFPLLSEAFQDAPQSLDFSFQRIKDTGKAFFYFFENWKKETIEQEGNYTYLKIDDIEHLPGKNSLMYYWLRDYGFHYNDVLSVISGIQSGVTGKKYLSSSHVLNLDREYLILGKDELIIDPLEMSATDRELKLPNRTYEILRLEAGVELDRSVENAMLDWDKLKFPLLVRNWEQGDKFVPLGMKNEKKISDLLIDLKVPLIHKKTVKVLCSGDQIAWVIGFRISELFKCDSITKSILYLKLRR